MADLVAGGIIGVVFAELYKVALELAKSMKFQPILGQVTSTLNSLKPLIEDMVGLNMNLKLESQALDNLQDEILKGLVLVRKCVKCSKLNVPKRYKYTKKLRKLDEFLKSLLETLKTEEMRDVKLNLFLTTGISKKVDEMANDVKEILLGTKKHGGLLEELLQGEKESSHLIRKNYDQIEQSEKEQKEFRNLFVRSVVMHKERVPSREKPLINWNEVKASSLPVGLDEPVKTLKTNLLKDGLQMLVLTGPQGSGKTKLAEQFCKDKEVEGTFKNNIFNVLVSKELSWEHIVQQLNDEYKKTSQLPDNIDDKVIAVKWLQQFLNEAGKKPLLLVLRDVWAGSEFLLETFDEFKMLNCKILVTSIYEFPRFSSRYYLEPLNDDNAIILLHHSASRDKSSCFSEDFARKVVARCRGFPLAIVEVGKSLRDRAIESWDKFLDNWYENSSFLDSETDFFGFLQSSKDTLGEKMDTVKECFMDLGSFPENQRIPVAALIDIWAVLYKLDEDTQSISNLYELTTQSQLANHIFTVKEKIDVNGYYSEHFVTQHYMRRQLAIYETGQDPIEDRTRLIIDICGNNVPKWLIEQKYQSIKARLLSISTDEKFTKELPSMQLPEVEVLILNFQTNNYALPGFVAKMENLKVVIVTNYGSSPYELRMFHLLGRLSHLKRIRLQNISISSISKIRLALKTLQKISFCRCSLAQAFISGRMRIPDAFPNLLEMNIDCCNHLNESLDQLCSLTSLKKLSITNCDDLSNLPDGIGKLVNLELLRLRSCKHLHKLPDSVRNLKMLNRLDISGCSSITTLPEHIGEMSSLRKLDMRQCKSLEKLPLSVLNLKQLQQVICDEVTEKLWREPFVASLSKKVTREDMST